jgi:hypothetical protein
MIVQLGLFIVTEKFLALREIVRRAGISFRKTKRAERVHGFDQAPDFIIPNEFNPQIVIEVKLTE